MHQKRKRDYRYTTVTVAGQKKSLYLGKPSSSPEARDHQQKMEQKRTTREREQELDQLNKAVDQALKALDMMQRAQLLLIGLYTRGSELRTLQEDVRCHATIN
jgi:hypothetical protein